MHLIRKASRVCSNPICMTLYRLLDFKKQSRNYDEEVKALSSWVEDTQELASTPVPHGDEAGIEALHKRLKVRAHFYVYALTGNFL